MSQKNRPTLKQQFADFINRIAPFDSNPLIQDTEHLQVQDDLFDSFLGKVDSSVLINSPGALIGLDFQSIDLYRINTAGSVDTIFTFTPTNIGTGQIGRIEIIKKSNDTFAFSNAVITPISNLNQAGTALSYYVHNINGTLIASSSLTIPKSDNISDANSDQLATSKAVNDLNAVKLSISRFNLEVGTPDLRVKVIEIGDWNMDSLGNILVPHALDMTKIRSINVVIRNDTDNQLSDISFSSSIVSQIQSGSASVIGVNIALVRLTGGFFDSVNYSTTPFNRGWITVTYES